MTISAGKYWGMRRMADAAGRFRMTAVSAAEQTYVITGTLDAMSREAATEALQAAFEGAGRRGMAVRAGDESTQPN